MNRNPEFAQLLNNPRQLQEAMQAASNPVSTPCLSTDVSAGISHMLLVITNKSLSHLKCCMDLSCLVADALRMICFIRITPITASQASVLPQTPTRRHDALLLYNVCKHVLLAFTWVGVLALHV